MSGGSTAIFGYAAQTLVALMQSLRLDHRLGGADWKTVTLEPEDKFSVASGDYLEKVDILWEYENGEHQAVQVKSTAGHFDSKEKIKIFLGHANSL